MYLSNAPKMETYTLVLNYSSCPLFFLPNLSCLRDDVSNVFMWGGGGAVAAQVFWVEKAERKI